jgi:hypothetical protein
VFFKVDLRKGCHQIPVNPADVPKTANTTPFGLFDYKRLQNAGAYFHHRIDNALSNVEAAFAFVVDVLVCSVDREAHRLHMCHLFTVLQPDKLVTHEKNCVCGTASIDFLDRTVSAAAVQSFPFHMMAVQDFPHPKTVKELPCWLLANSWCGKSIVANKLLGLQATGHLLHARCHLHLCSPLAAKVLKTARELIYTQQTESSAITF